MINQAFLVALAFYFSFLFPNRFVVKRNSVFTFLYLVLALKKLHVDFTLDGIFKEKNVNLGILLLVRFAFLPVFLIF